VSDTTTTAAEATTSSETTPAAGAGTQVPAGYVAQTELDRVEQQRRGFQAEAEKAKQELAQLRAAAASTTPAPAGENAPSQGFDPDAFRRSLLTDVVNVTRVATAAEKLKAEYPHAAVADPTIFDRAAEFGTVDAFTEAVKSSHDRIAALLTAQAPDPAAANAAAAAAAAGAVTPPGGAAGTAAGDPTPEQLLAMDTSEWDALEKASPGVINRVLRSVQ
jgi:hypothetical protein